MSRFYYVENSYLIHLKRHADSHVMNPSAESDPHRKFVFGMVFEIGGIKYFAPVSSLDKTKFGTPESKEHLLKLKADGTRDTTVLIERMKPRLFTIHNPHPRGDIIAFVRLDYMFPVHDRDYINNEVDIKNILDSNYKALVEQEYEVCKKNLDKIKLKAEKVYKNSKTPGHFLFGKCCDFNKLEIEYANWVISQGY